MNTGSKSNGNKRKYERQPPPPPQPIDLNSIARRTNFHQNLPPVPIVPPRPESGLTPSRLRSPHDSTQIIVNGQVIKIAESTDEDIILPLTPPRENNIPEFNNESQLSPNRYLDNNIKIVSTPVEKDEESKSSDSSPLTRVSTPIEEFTEPIPAPVLQPLNRINGINPMPYRTEPMAPPPHLMTNNINTFKPPEVKHNPLQNSSKNIKSLLPTFNRAPVKKIETPPRVKSPVNPFGNMDAHNSPETVNEEDQDEDEDDDDNQDDTQVYNRNIMSPVNIPYPVFDNNIKVASPVGIIGPKSPSMFMGKPIFNETGKSSTPKRVPITPPKNAPAMRATTPPPVFRPYSPQYKEDIYNESSTPVMPPPRESAFQGGSGVSNRPDYSKLTRDQYIYIRSEFKVKFGILRSTYPQWNVIEPHDSLTLDQVHDLYDHYIKQILISRETGNYKTYMVIFLMVIEVIGVKFLKLNMSGYTMSQLKIMNRYDSLFMELGEKWLVSGGSNWPVEVRIVMMMLFNAVIFLVVRYLCSWMGMDGLSDTLQNLIDGMLNGPSMLNSSGPIGSSNPIPDPPIYNTQSAAPAAEASSSGGNTIDKIADLFGNFVSKNSGNITEKIAEIGTMFTNKTQNANTKQKESNVKAKEPEKKKLNKKKLFDD